MKIEIDELMKSVLTRILHNEIKFQINMIETDSDLELPLDKTRYEIIKRCEKIIEEIKMDGDSNEL